MRFRTSGVNWEGRRWHLTAGGVTLAEQVSEIWPDPSPLDGTVASKAHDQNNPSSDHRPYPYTGPGIVRALDVGETVEDQGADLAERLRLSRDARIRYVLHENRIFSSYPRTNRAPFEWGPLDVGHENHVHVSFTTQADTNSDPWDIMAVTEDDITRIATAIWRYGYKTNPDGSELQPSTYQYLIRAKANTDKMLARIGALDTATDADLEALADYLITSLPDEVLDTLRDRLNE